MAGQSARSGDVGTAQRSSGQSGQTGMQRRSSSPAALDLASELDRLWRAPFSLLLNPFERLNQLTDVPAPAFLPKIDVLQRDNQLIVRADLPGVDRTDVQVTIEENALVISGERREEREEHEGDVQRIERLYGMFERRIPLPFTPDPSQVTAKLDRGVLEISLPLPAAQEEDRSRNVEVH
jgi:HSP20 family protein